MVFSSVWYCTYIIGWKEAIERENYLSELKSGKYKEDFQVMFHFVVEESLFGLVNKLKKGTVKSQKWQKDDKYDSEIRSRRPPMN